MAVKKKKIAVMILNSGWWKGEKEKAEIGRNEGG